MSDRQLPLFTKSRRWDTIHELGMPFVILVSTDAAANQLVIHNLNPMYYLHI